MRTLISLALAAIAASKEVLLTPPTTSGEKIAIVWIQGALCNNENYTQIAETV